MDAFKLKWIAIIGMILNHMVIAWWEIIPVWLAIPLYAAGGLTFPIMAYFIVEGYRHTSNIKKYLLRLFIFGAISFPFHALTFGIIGLNIMFTMIVGIFSMMLYDKIKMRPLFWVIFVIISLLTSFPIFFDWAIVGVVVILLSHIIRSESKRRIIPAFVSAAFMLVFTLFSLWSLDNPYADLGGIVDLGGLPEVYVDRTLLLVSLAFPIGCVIAAVFLKNFSGERGKRMKWLFYAFYPLHLVLLGLVALALGFADLSIFGIGN